MSNYAQKRLRTRFRCKKVDDLDVGKLKTVPIDLEKLSDIEDNEVVQNTKLNTLKIKVNKVDKEILDTTALIFVSQYNTD